MADRRPVDQKPKGAGKPSRVNRLLSERVAKDYSGLTNMILLANLKVTSAENQEIRGAVRQNKLRLRMVRNRLTVKALSSKGGSEIQQLLAGPSFILDGEDPVKAAKQAVEMVGKYNKSLKLLGGLLEGKVLDAKAIESLAKSKSKPELIGDVVMLAKSPGARVAGQLKGPGSRIAGAIKALVEKLEKSGAGAAAEAAKPA